MKLKQVILIVMISSASAFGSVALYNKLFTEKSSSIGSLTTEGKLPVNYAHFIEGQESATGDPIDFTKAASAAVPAVVHIKTKVPAKKVDNGLSRQRNTDDLMEWFFGPGSGFGPTIIPEQRASGSGVLVSDDGYIVTNNHVISTQSGGVADEITVTLHDRKTFKARIIGRDPNSDIAVLKIDGNNLPYMIYGNSNDIKLGQWVLAVGYPLTLETTVTAGIISATGRSIGINSRQVKRGDTPIESFIQTDAAVNQGNSGGALINTSGQLIGINSAILAPTGTYAGYSFAIPVSIVKKIVEDIVKYGDVQRGYLGINYIATNEDMSEEDLKRLGIPTNVEGVYVTGVTSDGGAAAAGIKKGDVITKVNGSMVLSGIQMSTQIAGFRPGDQVPVTYLRSGKEYNTNVILKKRTDVVSANAAVRLGGELATLSRSKAANYGVAGGVVVNKVNDGGILKIARVSPGFVIVSVITAEGEQEVSSIDELNTIVQGQTGSIRIRGFYPDYGESYTYTLNLER